LKALRYEVLKTASSVAWNRDEDNYSGVSRE
jgi:hypothetical protein